MRVDRWDLAPVNDFCCRISPPPYSNKVSYVIPLKIIIRMGAVDANSNFTNSFSGAGNKVNDHKTFVMPSSPLSIKQSPRPPHADYIEIVLFFIARKIHAKMLLSLLQRTHARKLIWNERLKRHHRYGISS